MIIIVTKIKKNETKIKTMISYNIIIKMTNNNLKVIKMIFLKMKFLKKIIKNKA
jgi:hypothetical protein